MLAAETDAAIGRPYNLTDGSKITTRRYITDLINIIGVDYKLRSVPYVPAYIIAYILELYAKIRRYKVHPAITRYSVRIARYDQVFDISRAMYELGYRPKIQYKEALSAMTGYIRALYYGQK
jgi:nucleoside-diphosphate-sugar epimerase